MNIKYIPAVWLGKIICFVLRIFRPYGGSALPGLIINKLFPKFLPVTLKRFTDGIIVVTGSVGKSTTANMVANILRSHGIKVYTNSTTANIKQGITSDILNQMSFTGGLDSKIAVLELDEAHGALIFEDIDVSVAVLNNVVADQVDRFHAPHMVRDYLHTIGRRAVKGVVVNNDDAVLQSIVDKFTAPVHFFGVAQEVYNNLPNGLGLSKIYDTRLQAGEGYRVATYLDGIAQVGVCGEHYSIELTTKGVHYVIDAVAAISATHIFLGDAFNAVTAIQSLAETKTVFGRGERIKVKDVEIDYIVFQNPASLNLNLAELPADTEQILFALGTADKDLSYFWQCDLSSLKKVAIATGEKAGEAALMLAYAGVEVETVETDFCKALNDFLLMPQPKTGVKTIITTIDMLRESRAHWRLDRKQAS